MTTTNAVQPPEALLDDPGPGPRGDELAGAGGAHDEQARRPAPLPLDGRGHVPQRGPHDPLVGAARPLDDGAGRVQRVQNPCRLGFGDWFAAAAAAAAVIVEKKARGKFGHEAFYPVQSHEEDGGPGGHVARRGRGFTLLAGAGADEDLVGDVAPRHGDAGEQRRAEGRGDAGQDADTRGEPAGGEEVELLGAAAVDVGVPLLEAEDGAAGAETREGEVQELLLGGVGVAGELARDVHLRAARDEGEDGGGDELVGEDEVGGEDGCLGGYGQEGGVARAGACEDDCAEFLLLLLFRCRF